MAEPAPGDELSRAERKQAKAAVAFRRVVLLVMTLSCSG
jgi:hypothetical protein